MNNFIEETLTQLDNIIAEHKDHDWSQESLEWEIKDFIKQKLIELQQRDIEIVETSRRKELEDFEVSFFIKGFNLAIREHNKMVDIIKAKIKG